MPAGRTTFVNTLCGQSVLEHKESDDPSTAHVEEGVKIQPVTVGASPLWYNMNLSG
jgi:cell division control protein 11